jgi:hypothetical protein
MSNNHLQKSENLIRALNEVPRGTPISTAQCERQWNVSRQSVHWYSKAGWLNSLGHGYYIRQGETPTLAGTVATLEASGFKVHIAGKSALDLKGFSHYLSLGNGKIFLYGRGVRHLPQWLSKFFSVEMATKKLFKEHDETNHRLFVRPLDQEDDSSPYVSDPERAILEMLDNVPMTQTMEEAKEIMEGMHSLNPGKLEILLEHCVRIRVKRLFWLLCKELDLPVIKEIHANKVDFGSSTPYIVVPHHGRPMVIKNPITGKI